CSTWSTAASSATTAKTATPEPTSTNDRPTSANGSWPASPSALDELQPSTLRLFGSAGCEGTRNRVLGTFRGLGDAQVVPAAPAAHGVTPDPEARLISATPHHGRSN